MARPPAHHSPCWNPLPTSKDGITRAALEPAPIEGSDTSTPAPAMSRIPTFATPVAFIVAFSSALAFAVVPAIALSPNNELFK